MVRRPVRAAVQVPADPSADPRVPGLPSLPGLVSWVAGESLLFADPDAPFTASVAPGAADLVLVVGENASGKSLFFRVLCARAAQAGMTPVSISIRERSGAGSFDLARMRQLMMFGDEIDSSTGAVSVRATVAGFNNLDRPGGSLLALDEPELGLSEAYARALGELVGARTAQVPAGCAGVVVVTHSRALAAGLVDGRGAAPTFVHVGSPVADLAAWQANPETRSVEDLLALPEVGLARFRAAHALLRRD